MPLRDHFRLSTSRYASWEGLHGGWPMTIVMQLARTLPPGFAAEPRVHVGALFEVGVGTMEGHAGPGPPLPAPAGNAAPNGWVAPQPTLTIETDLAEQYEYAVHVWDLRSERGLVAAIELVSPANKDRPDHRRSFVAKLAALLQQGICVTVVDLVTARRFNLYAELLELIGARDPAIADSPPSIYAATCRARRAGRKSVLDTWSHVLTVGAVLPSLPLWIDEDRAIALDLDATYEEACRALRIP